MPSSAATLTVASPDLRGSTTPRLYTPPLVQGAPGPCGCGCALTADTSLGFSAIEFAEEVLGIMLMPWQRWLLIHAFELRPDGRFRFRTILVLVGRQNGKTTLVEVKNLWKMFVLRVLLVIGTAQILDYAEESWDKAVEIVESIPELNAEVEHVDRTNGKKALKLTNGTRWKIAAASRRGGRSLSADDVNLDELREHHNWDSWAAVTKTTMARSNAQIWAVTNAGDDRSVVLNQLQEKGRALAALAQEAAEKALSLPDLPEFDPSMGHFEWSAPDDCPIDDPQFWAMSNPSLGYPQGISIEALRSAASTDPEPVFRTECLCQRVPELAPSKIPLTAWVKCEDPTSRMVGRLALTWQVSWKRDRGAICAAGFRPDGRPHVELVEYRDGVDWIPQRLGEICARQPIGVVVFDPGGPEASMLNEVTERLPVTLEPHAMTMREYGYACGRIYDATINDQLRHLGDGRLLDMLRRSATRSLSDAWAWDLRHSGTDICGLTGITKALFGLTLLEEPPKPAPPPLVDLLPAKDRSDFDLLTVRF